MNFSALVNSLDSIAKTPCECRICPDQYIGRLDNLEVAGAISTRLPPEKRPLINGLIVVLESPHTNEYEGEPGPAMGATGRLLAKHLQKVIEPFSVDNPPVVLMNAVQYQCSLGCLPTIFRDQVFTTVWNGGGRKDFIRRLTDVYNPGDYVVCCCTKGSEIQRFGELRQMVFAAIVETVPPNMILRRTHPASWRRLANRKYEWKST